MNRLAIGIIVWNNARDAIECAESLLAQTYQQLSIVFIDNNSKLETVGKLQEFINKQKKQNLHLVKTGYNGGTAGGFNAIARWAADNDYEYYGSLNADAIADTKWCAALVKELDDHPEAGIATGKLFHRDGKTIDTTGDQYTTWGIPGPRLRDQPAELAPNTSGDIFGSTGGGYISRVRLWLEVGLYDEKLFMYFEDVDYCFRAQLAGYKTRYTPAAVAYHKRGASADTVPGLAAYNTFKNLPVVFVKNVPFSLCWHMYPRFVLTYTLILGNAIKNGSGGPALNGWVKSWLLLGHMFRERRRIQASRKVSDAYIWSILLHDIPPEQTGMRKFRKFFTGRG